MSENVTQLPERPGLYRGPVADAHTAQVVEAVNAAGTITDLEDAVSAHRGTVDRLPSDYVQRVRDAVDAGYARLRTQRTDSEAATPRMSPPDILESLDRLERARAEISADSYHRTRAGLERAFANAVVNDQDDVIAMLALVARFMPAGGAHLIPSLRGCAQAVEAGACTSPEP